MTQVKLFEEISRSSTNSEVIEKRVNQFLQDNANSIKVIDIKHTTAVTTNARCYDLTAMIIYEKLH